MTTATVSYVCANAAKAAQARGVLLAQGFADRQISVESTKLFSYDAATYADGGSEIHTDVWLVTGRKP
jgi:hypothetical protein